MENKELEKQKEQSEKKFAVEEELQKAIRIEIIKRLYCRRRYFVAIRF